MHQQKHTIYAGTNSGIVTATATSLTFGLNIRLCINKNRTLAFGSNSEHVTAAPVPLTSCLNILLSINKIALRACHFPARLPLPPPRACHFPARVPLPCARPAALCASRCPLRVPLPCARATALLVCTPLPCARAAAMRACGGGEHHCKTDRSSYNTNTANPAQLVTG